MPSNMWTVERQDAVKSFLTGLLGAALVAVVSYLQNLINAGNFNLADVDWNAVLNAGYAGVLGDLARRFGTDSNGKLLGRIG